MAEYSIVNLHIFAARNRNCMDFKEVSISDKQVIDSYLTSCGRMHCDYSFGGIICWKHVYRHFWCIDDGFLFLKVLYPDGHIEYREPIGGGDFTHLVPELEEDACRSGQSLVLTGITENGVAACRAQYPDFGFAQVRHYADYIYNASDLRELHGKRYQQKRNHVHKFESEYQYRYVNLTPDLFPDCLALETEWLNVRSARGEGIPESELKEELSDEQKVIKRAFTYWTELGLIGGAIYVGDRMVAFSFGSPISDRMFCTHIEKADISYDGAFPVINQQFAIHLPFQYEFIDREDDAGLSGLRQSKLSYHPAFLSPKRVGRRLSFIELQVRALWLECFTEDTVEDADQFLIERFKPAKMLCREADGKLVSMLHIIPFGKVAYIFAVATSPSYRRRGIAGELCREALERCRQEGFHAVALIPSGPSVREWYAGMGFSGDYPIEFKTEDEFDFGTGNQVMDRAMILPVDSTFDINELISDGRLLLTE